MSHRPTCQTADFFLLRTPGLPLDALAPRGRPWLGEDAEDAGALQTERDTSSLRQTLGDLARRPHVREALALASPDLVSRLEAWLEGSLDTEAARPVERALLKYLSRMSSRSTPFGLFAGVSKGSWGPASRLRVGSWLACRKSVRLDWGVLETLVDRLEREPEVRTWRTFEPNSSLYLRAGWYRYLERRDQPEGQGRTYHLEAVEATPHLDFVLQQAEVGARLEDLVLSLAHRMAIEPREARAFLDLLIDSQVLTGDLHPPLSSPDPLHHVTAALQSQPATTNWAGPLLALARELKALQEAPLGSHPRGYGAVVAAVPGLELPSGTRDVIQVDLFCPSPELVLGPGVRRALEAGAETLRKLTPQTSEGSLGRFRAAFQERYGSRWMPLLEVLDEESGLGFDGDPALDSTLLENLPLRNPSPLRQLSSRDVFLMKQMPRWLGSRAWELTDSDLEAMVNPDAPPFPASFAAQASLEAGSQAALDAGDFRFWMEHHSGPTAARWLGRFASGDSELLDALQRHLRKEESLRPEVVFAEVVHVPEGRMGNVLARPSLRDYEIPFLATPGVPPGRVILPSDLQLTVRGGKVVLASARLGRQVVPRLSSAHNFARGPVVYRFLAHLQDQDGRPGGWSWGALVDQPFLPRVTHGRHVLSKARWRIEARELKDAQQPTKDGAWGAFQRLRARRGLPRLVMLTDADNALLVDLDQVLWVETLHHLVANRPTFTLTECFPDPGQAVVTSPDGRFAHELVIPFEATSPPHPRISNLPGSTQASGARTFPPGSEWLYLKLYCGPASADRLLVELAPLLRSTHVEGLWDRWHFLRYRDPDHHLRLRFHGSPGRLISEFLPRVHGHLAGPLAQGLLWTWRVDTFEPELERYGGALGFDLAESWFHEDSQVVLDHLTGGLPVEDRWKTGLGDVDAIWSALGLDLPARLDLARNTREAFRKEFGDPGDGAVQMGVKFRALRKELERRIFAGAGSEPAPGQVSLGRIRDALNHGLIQEDRLNLAGSLAHMHLNRLLRSNPREYEWVLMEFLSRLYESRLARHPVSDRAESPNRNETPGGSEAGSEVAIARHPGASLD